MTRQQRAIQDYSDCNLGIHRDSICTLTSIIAFIWFPVFVQAHTEATCKQPGDLLGVTSEVMCGPNGLYLMLRLYGIPVTGGVTRYAPSHPHGMSLLELRNAFADFGLPVEIREYTVDDLCKRFRSPLLALTNYFLGGTDHYVVIVAADSDSVCYIDPTTARVRTKSPEELSRSWRGYVIVPCHQNGNRMLAGAVLVVSALLWLLATHAILRAPQSLGPLYRWWSFGRHAPIVVLLGMGIFVWNSIARADSSPRSIVDNNLSLWRKPTNDGINCLYMQLRLLGYRGDYYTFREEASDGAEFQSLASLARLAKRFGYDLEPRQLTTSELAQLGRPVLVHIENDGIEAGTFCLVYHLNNQSVGVIDGSTVRWMVMSSDSFGRVWSRYALVLRPASESFTLVRRCGTALLIVVVASLLLRDRATRRRGSVPRCPQESESEPPRDKSVCGVSPGG